MALKVLSFVFVPLPLATFINGLPQIGRDFPPGFSELLGQFSEKDANWAQTNHQGRVRCPGGEWLVVADLTVESPVGLRAAELAVPALGVAMTPIVGLTMVPISIWIRQKIEKILLFGALRELGGWSCEAVASALTSGVDCTDMTNNALLKTPNSMCQCLSPHVEMFQTNLCSSYGVWLHGSVSQRHM
jgi:hypothetical protein